MSTFYMIYPICYYFIHVLYSDIEKKRKRWALDAELLLKDHEEHPENTRTVFYLAQVGFFCYLHLVL